MDQPRKDRIAHNESAFRSMNESLRATLDKRQRSADELPGFVCECGDSDCAAVVRVPVETYEKVRAGSRRFLVRPGHEIAEVEDIVDEGEHYIIVEKHEDSGEIVDRTDPRRP